MESKIFSESKIALETVMKTMILIVFDIFHTVNAFANFKALSSHYLFHLFGKRKHCVKFHFSICNERRIIKFGFLKSPAALFRGNMVYEFQFLCKS